MILNIILLLAIIKPVIAADPFSHFEYAVSFAPCSTRAQAAEKMEITRPDSITLTAQSQARGQMFVVKINAAEVDRGVQLRMEEVHQYYLHFYSICDSYHNRHLHVFRRALSYIGRANVQAYGIHLSNSMPLNNLDTFDLTAAVEKAIGAVETPTPRGFLYSASFNPGETPCDSITLSATAPSTQMLHASVALKDLGEIATQRFTAIHRCFTYYMRHSDTQHIDDSAFSWVLDTLSQTHLNINGPYENGESTDPNATDKLYQDIMFDLKLRKVHGTIKAFKPPQPKLRTHALTLFHQTKKALSPSLRKKEKVNR